MVISLNGHTDFGSPFVEIGPGGSIDECTLGVTGILALKSGWKTSVKFLTRDKNWVATTSSAFSCHLLKTFVGCSDGQMASSLGSIFALYNVNNSRDVIGYGGMHGFVSGGKDGEHRVVNRVSVSAACASVCVLTVIVLCLQFLSSRV